MGGWDRWRQMGLETLQAGRAQGFFTPYRYADRVKAPAGYPELETLFKAAESSMEHVLKDIDFYASDLAALNGPPPIPRWDQTWFPRLDGAAAWAIVRSHTPEQIIEVGSGHSTRMLAHALGDASRITCIDPEPRADIKALGVTHHARVLSADDVGMFAPLESNDIAFFDSSHILWPGTDVDITLNRIIPALKPGVLIHIHDILLPDPYPQEWEWRGYTEQNGVAPLLLGACEIVFSSHYALTRMGAATRPGVKALPIPDGAFETSLWLRRR
ncbi:MAG: class I SAM-dependent methyltransferase [Pseudomonadota bacterium]